MSFREWLLNSFAIIEIGCKETDGFREFYVKDNGIGLSIVEKVAEIHGGSVRVESEKGKGATFWFSAPR